MLVSEIAHYFYYDTFFYFKQRVLNVLRMYNVPLKKARSNCVSVVFVSEAHMPQDRKKPSLDEAMTYV